MESSCASDTILPPRYALRVDGGDVEPEIVDSHDDQYHDGHHVNDDGLNRTLSSGVLPEIGSDTQHPDRRALLARARALLAERERKSRG